MIPYLGTDCENVFRTSKHWTKVCKDASFFKRVSIGMCHKTIADVHHGFGDRTSACREFSHPRAESHSRSYAAIPERTKIGPVLKVHIIQFLGNHRTEIQIPSTTTPNRTSWVVMCPGKNRYVEELHLNDPGHHLTNSELLWKDRRIQCTTVQKKFFILKKGSGMTFLPTKISEEILFKPKSPNWS